MLQNEPKSYLEVKTLPTFTNKMTFYTPKWRYNDVCTPQFNYDSDSSKPDHMIKNFTLFCYLLAAFTVFSLFYPIHFSILNHFSHIYNKDFTFNPDADPFIPRDQVHCPTNIGDDPVLRKFDNPHAFLKSLKISNPTRLTIGHLNINSVRNKFEELKWLIIGNLDIFVITESKLDDTFPTNQFHIDGFAPPFRLDRTIHGGGVLIYVREDLPCKKVNNHSPPKNLEGIFFELNLRKRKWLVFGGYNPHKKSIKDFTKTTGAIIDQYISTYDNFLLLGDFNSDMNDTFLSEFCDIYNLKNLIVKPTCFKNPT